MPASGCDTAASLFAEYGTSLRNYVQRLVPGYELAHAEDVVQETFVRAIQHLKHGKPLDSPQGFLWKTARNVTVSMFYRGRKHTSTDSHPDMDEHSSPADDYSPEYKVMLQQKLDAFSVAIAALPQRYQEAFIRRRVWGESCREIAATMQLSEKAVANYATLGWKLLLAYCEERDIVFNDFDDPE